MANEIIWPEGFIPGFSDNFASNEVIVAGLSAAEIWPWLSEAPLWPRYYANAADIAFDGGKGPHLEENLRFRFKTFGFPVEARCTEYLPPAEGRPGRIAWHGWVGEDSDAENRLDVHHAWLIEDLSGGRVRVLTQETQQGKPARALAEASPNPMINGHQDWLNGLIGAARKAKGQ
ncbi:SRPBCC domain-containing protein [Acidisoma cellulosilytica]|uniref:SRPBCC domain-containing protein n=1 Tax=Acidisoma cellulosilyticum TaxID=2802395 RepID=A0A963YZE7_9PROT|nr:SRPBCC domain-containing protein [Acidisoma cellulosilyticum]MCB8878993.1 SRPBCC domain-containing protein [Acidisoma cellulosilyticum]